MSFKRAAVATLAAGTIATVGITVCAPKLSSAHSYEDQGGHAQQITNEQLRDEGNAAGDGEYGRQLIPGEVRVPEPEAKIPFDFLP